MADLWAGKDVLRACTYITYSKPQKTLNLIYATVAVECDNIVPPSVLVEWEILDRIAELDGVGVISPFHGTECRVRSGNPV